MRLGNEPRRLAVEPLVGEATTRGERFDESDEAPTVEKLFELLSAVAPGEDFVFQESPRHQSRAA